MDASTPEFSQAQLILIILYHVAKDFDSRTYVTIDSDASSPALLRRMVEVSAHWRKLLGPDRHAVFEATTSVCLSQLSSQGIEIIHKGRAEPWGSDTAVEEIVANNFMDEISRLVDDPPSEPAAIELDTDTEILVQLYTRALSYEEMGPLGKTELGYMWSGYGCVNRYYILRQCIDGLREGYEYFKNPDRPTGMVPSDKLIAAAAAGLIVDMNSAPSNWADEQWGALLAAIFKDQVTKLHPNSHEERGSKGSPALSFKSVSSMGMPGFHDMDIDEPGDNVKYKRSKPEPW